MITGTTRNPVTSSSTSCVSSGVTQRRLDLENFENQNGRGRGRHGSHREPHPESDPYIPSSSRFCKLETTAHSLRACERQKRKGVSARR